MEEKWVYLCEDSVEGIFTAVYTAYEQKHPHDFNEIRVRDTSYYQELFCHYISVDTNYEKAKKVARTLNDKVSPEVYEALQRCAVSCDPGKADAIYRGIILALKMGRKVLGHLTDPDICHLMQIDRNVSHEIHAEIEFLRFEELENGVLFAKINPKNAVLPYLAEHFADRFSGENWVIADTVHRTILVHEREKRCSFAKLSDLDLDELELSMSADEELWQSLWKCFVDTIAIKERINPKLQRQMLPIRYRKYMRELRDK